MSKPTIDKVAKVEDRSLPIFAEFDKITETIRQRAFEIFRAHGFGSGNDLEHWLTAEREVCWPATELTEDDKRFTLKVALAGFDDDDIMITANPRELMIRASDERSERSKKADDKDKPEVHWSEFHQDRVFRHVRLPVDVDVDNIKAEFKHGMLTIVAPKARHLKATGKKVDISTAA